MGAKDRKLAAGLMKLAGYGLNEYTEVKHVHWDLGTPAHAKMFGVLISD